MKFEYPVGATPLDPNEIDGLIPIHITKQAELNEFEQFDILKAEQWLVTKKFSVDDRYYFEIVRNSNFFLGCEKLNESNGISNEIY